MAAYVPIQTMGQLRLFMQHHVFAVWDFMLLLKALQQQLAPSGSPWLPSPHPRAASLINQLIAEEECNFLPVQLGGPSALQNRFPPSCSPSLMLEKKLGLPVNGRSHCPSLPIQQPGG